MLMRPFLLLLVFSLTTAWAYRYRARFENVRWTRYLDSEVSVQESAFIYRNPRLILFTSFGNLTLGYRGSVTLYNYLNVQPLMFISPILPTFERRGFCFITTPEQTYEELAEELRSRNATIVNSTMGQRTLDARVMTMWPEESWTLAGQPLVWRVCRGWSFFDTREPPYEGVPITHVIKVLAAESKVEIKGNLGPFIRGLLRDHGPGQCYFNLNRNHRSRRPCRHRFTEAEILAHRLFINPVVRMGSWR